MHRLVSGFTKIHNRETAKAKSAARIVKDQVSRIVRSAMRHHVAHAFDQRALNITARCSVFPNSADPAHVVISDCVRTRSGSDGIAHSSRFYDPVATAPG